MSLFCDENLQCTNNLSFFSSFIRLSRIFEGEWCLRNFWNRLSGRSIQIVDHRGSRPTVPEAPACSNRNRTRVRVSIGRLDDGKRPCRPTPINSSPPDGSPLLDNDQRITTMRRKSNCQFPKIIDPQSSRHKPVIAHWLSKYKSKEANSGRKEAQTAEKTRGRAQQGKRADVSEVIEAGGHPGRKSHESRASGREQYRETLLLFLLFLLHGFPFSRFSLSSPFSSPFTFASSWFEFSRLGSPFSTVPPRSRAGNRHRRCSSASSWLLGSIRVVD